MRVRVLLFLLNQKTINEFKSIIMKNHINQNTGKMKNEKFFIQVVVKLVSRYINGMTKALYPPENVGVKSKNDQHRTFMK